VAREPRQRKLQHDLARPLRPAGRALGLLQTLQVAAHVNQHARKFRPDRRERTAHALARSGNVLLQVAVGGECHAGAATPLRRRHGRPAHGDARRHLRKPEIRTQPLARIELDLRDQRLAITVLAPPQPREWALGGIDAGAGGRRRGRGL
jgi:hypothetical protein